ncbi:MAG TPA: hypothetical protein PLT76_06920 [Candidatus Omnitrophota bacterium]|nr:hypothetical protein [Candidatus Omnitrophota bacterium]HQO58438.1 hypothetical protein [Candidatus Omnitrophota bacterium]
MRRFIIFPWLRQRREREKRARDRQRLVQEIDGNLEIYYVMTQRDVRKPLRISSWDGEAPARTAFPAPFWEYRERVQRYNARLIEFLDYQRWYSGDIDRQTREHALVLEDKKDRVDEVLRTLKPVMAAAQEVLAEAGGNKPV